MNLDDPTIYSTLDPQNMLGEIGGLPDQLEKAWALGQTLPLPQVQPISRIVLAGMGSPGIGAELLAAYAEPLCAIPIFVHRDYDLPAWASGADTLVMVLSYSGETEEMISTFDQATTKGCTRLVITTGGKLAEIGKAAEAIVWTFTHPAPQFAALGYTFALSLAALSRLGLIPEPSAELTNTLAAMRAQQAQLVNDVPVVQNPAKRYAGQLIGRWPVFLAAEFLVPVARRWKMQLNELAKAWAQFEALPEADHGTLAGLLAPEELFSKTMTMFINAPAYQPRNTLRSELTRKVFMLEGIPTDFYTAQGETRLEQQWTALHFGDYMAYYLAIAYGVDPALVDIIHQFKEEMANAGNNLQ